MEDTQQLNREPLKNGIGKGASTLEIPCCRCCKNVEKGKGSKAGLSQSGGSTVPPLSALPLIENQSFGRPFQHSGCNSHRPAKGETKWEAAPVRQ